MGRSVGHAHVTLLPAAARNDSLYGLSRWRREKAFSGGYGRPDASTIAALNLVRQQARGGSDGTEVPSAGALEDSAVQMIVALVYGVKLNGGSSAAPALTWACALESVCESRPPARVGYV